MTGKLLNLQMSEGAEIAYSTLGADAHRRLGAWFDHLRHWRDDEFIRSNSRLLEPTEGIYVFQTGHDYFLVFKIADDNVIVLSIFREATVRKFQIKKEKSTP